MNTCGTCKHWSYISSSDYGDCENIEIDKVIEFPPINTKENFGCVLYDSVCKLKGGLK